MEDITQRHPATRRLLVHFQRPAYSEVIAQECERLALLMVACLADGAELTVGLRKLLEARDSFMRAAEENAA